MAMESACKLQVGRDRYDGRVRMEADHIDFSGTTKFRFRLTEITHPRREEEAIRFNFHGSPVVISLDNSRTTDGWMNYILHPQTLADKLGVQTGHTVRVLNVEDATLMASLTGKSVKIINDAVGDFDIALLGIERPAELRQIEDLAEFLRLDGAIWVVLPKSVRTVTKANVFAAAKEAGLKQTEVFDFSENRAAYKIVRPAIVRKKVSETGRAV